MTPLSIRLRYTNWRWPLRFWLAGLAELLMLLVIGALFIAAWVMTPSGQTHAHLRVCGYEAGECAR